VVQEGRGPRLTFFGGKGGVGKTTCAAAAAVRAATEGARVLVLSTDPAHSLGDALGVGLGPRARRVPLRPRARGELHAAELDADKALGRWLREREEAIRVIANRGTYLDEEDIDRFLSLSFPGVDELVGLVELMRLARERPYDRVVVDTAPTGHTLRLLEMPDTLARLGQVLDDMHAKHRFLASSIGGSWRPDFADETIADIAGEARVLHELLRDRSRASFTWVTLAEELSVRESEDGVLGIERLGALVDVVVVNRGWPEPDRVCPLCSARVALEAVQRRRIGELFAGKALLLVPASPSEPRGPAALLGLAESVRPLTAPPSPVVGSKPTPASRGRAPAIPIAETVRLAFFGGKGGVGKTTAAAACAIELAETRPDARFLLLSTDPAHSLGDVLAAPVSDEARPIAKGPKNLDVRELDAAHAWEIERASYRKGLDELFASIFRGRMDATFDRAVLEDLLDLAPPGIDELLALVALLDAVVGSETSSLESRPYDLVVVDTAPTGHTLRLLALPESALEWVHALMNVILKYRSVVGLGEFASDLTRFARRLRTLIAWLADPTKTAFVIVTRPSALPRLETERLARDLGRLGIPIAAVLANAVTTPSCERCVSAAEVERPELERLARLARRVAAPGDGGSGLLAAPAVSPVPRGAAELRRWRRIWSKREGRAP
jgi:arsenite-transporting ATPase